MKLRLINIPKKMIMLVQSKYKEKHFIRISHISTLLVLIIKYATYKNSWQSLEPHQIFGRFGTLDNIEIFLY